MDRPKAGTEGEASVSHPFAPHLLEGHVHPGRFRDLDLEVIGEEGDLIEQIGGDDPSLPLGRFLPDLLDIHIGQVASDVLERLRDLVPFL